MLDDLLTPPADDVLKVIELTRLIKQQLEGNFGRVWVQGEVSNLRRQSSGHVYFSLKDAQSQIPCALFARDAARQSFELKDGMELLLMGEISVYEPHGRYQLIAKIAVQSGAGRLQLEFQRLKQKLAAEGLFAAERKRPLPTLPRRIAVLTSPTGAAVRDFLRILHRREYRGQVAIIPARVQGRGAGAELAAALDVAAKVAPAFDLVVLTRGGGSIEDLWAFNEEALARAVAACPIPVLSAVGHEIDTVLTDYAADHRAETPSGAAELISSLYLQASQRCHAAEERLLSRVSQRSAEMFQGLRDYHARLRIIAPDKQLRALAMAMDERENRLRALLRARIHGELRRLGKSAERMARHHPVARLSLARERLAALSKRSQRALAADREKRSKKLRELEQRLQNGSLNSALKRGFAVVLDGQQEVVDSARQAELLERMTLRFHDGELEATRRASPPG